MGDAIDAPNFLRTIARDAHTVSGLTGLAELIHNSFDAGATRLDIRVLPPTSKEGWEDEPMLLFSDNGSGMSREELQKLFKLAGTRERTVTDVGRWGVGSKYGSMRNADAAIFFTCDESGCMSVGLLSPAQLEGPPAAHRCPVVSLDDSMQLLDDDVDAGTPTLDRHNHIWYPIAEYTPFTIPECYRILSELLHSGHGTRVYLFSLCRATEDLKRFALDWESTPGDIRDPVAQVCLLPHAVQPVHVYARLATDTSVRARAAQERTFEIRDRKGQNKPYLIDYSLRASCEVNLTPPAYIAAAFLPLCHTPSHHPH